MDGRTVLGPSLDINETFGLFLGISRVSNVIHNRSHKQIKRHDKVNLIRLLVKLRLVHANQELDDLLIRLVNMHSITEIGLLQPNLQNSINYFLKVLLGDGS